MNDQDRGVIERLLRDVQAEARSDQSIREALRRALQIGRETAKEENES